jgi:hypothetical protein
LKDITQLNSVENLTLVDFQPNVSGNNSKGGLWDRPFGKDNSWWSVAGGSGTTWECGDALTSFDGNRYETQHNVFYRGEVPSKESVVERYLTRLKNSKQ